MNYESFFLSERNIANMLFAGWEVRMVKDCDLGLQSADRGPEVTVFHYTDRP